MQSVRLLSRALFIVAAIGRVESIALPRHPLVVSARQQLSSYRQTVAKPDKEAALRHEIAVDSSVDSSPERQERQLAMAAGTAADGGRGGKALTSAVGTDAAATAFEGFDLRSSDISATRKTRRELPHRPYHAGGYQLQWRPLPPALRDIAHVTCYLVH